MRICCARPAPLPLWAHPPIRAVQATAWRVFCWRAGGDLLGQPVAADLAAITRPVDVVDIFRNSEAALDVVRAAIREKDRLGIKAVWMQLGVINEVAATEAAAAGLTVVMDRCPAIEWPRLLGR